MPVEKTYSELNQFASDRVLFINCYHGLYEIPNRDYDYVIYTSFGEAFNKANLTKLLEDFKNSFVIVVTARLYPDIPHKDSRYQIISIPSAYAWYSTKMPRENINLKNKSFAKRFLSLNNMGRWSRQALCQFMMQFNLIDKSYFSYHCNSPYLIDRQTVFYEIDQQIGSHWFNRCVDNSRLFSMLPITTGIDNFPGNDWTAGNVDFYNNSFCSVVTETYIDENHDPFFTEKTMKPLAYGHPFLLYSAAGALVQLRSLGFETFPGKFDENYDVHTNRQMRLETVFHEILRISLMPDKDITELYDSMIPILEHNMNQFWTVLPARYAQDIHIVKQQIADIVLR